MKDAHPPHTFLSTKTVCTIFPVQKKMGELKKNIIGLNHENNFQKKITFSNFCEREKLKNEEEWNTWVG